MNGRITRLMESLSTFGYFLTIAAITVVGWNIGADNGSTVLGAFLGLVFGFVGATVFFGLVNVMLGIHRNTTELLLVQRHGPEGADEILRAAARAPGFMGMDPQQIVRFMTNGYIAVFLAYMFLPLLIMVGAAFNENRNPSISPWTGFTFGWFDKLMAKDELWTALTNSLIIGVCVVVISVILGLAGALLITRLQTKAKSLIYGVLVSPVLVPGVILGVSTLLLWDTVGVGGGLFLSIIAQSSFISAYAMLLFMARLQRFDPALEEAALDLGAPHQQVFWLITLPFLRPTIVTAAVLAFLQSFENYNTTLFTIGRESTVTIFIGSAVKQGQEPTINALAVIFITLTLIVAVIYEIRRRANKVKAEIQRELAKRADQEIATEGVRMKPAAATA
ncbi:MAG: ABC transporter permease [Kiloniellaceae bacterium]